MNVTELKERRRAKPRRESTGRRPEDRDVTHEALLALISKLGEQASIDRQQHQRERDALLARLIEAETELKRIHRRVAWFGGGVAALVTALGLALRAGWLP